MSDPQPLGVKIAVPYESAHRLVVHALTSERNAWVRPVTDNNDRELTALQIESVLRSEEFIWAGGKYLDESDLFDALEEVAQIHPKLVADFLLHDQSMERHSLLGAMVVSMAVKGEI